MLKTFALALLLLPQTIVYPPGAGVDSAGVTPTLPQSGVYADAIAVWTFNDPNNLGLEGNDASVGFSADFETGSSQYAERADTADLSVGPGVSWAALAWIRLESDSKYIFSKTEGATGSGDWESFYAVAGDLFCKFHDGTAQRTSQMGTLNAGVRYLVMCRYDATANEWISGIDAVLDSAATATVGDGADTTDKFYIGAQSGVTTMDGIVGPVYWYRSASGGEVPTDAQVTSLYNSSKGKLCADLSAAELVDLAACWDMTEDGGPYIDDIGSNDLTGQNTPTRAAGLTITGTGDPSLYLTEVNTPTATGGALGYAFHGDGVSDQHGTVNDASLSVTDSDNYGACFWFRATDSDALFASDKPSGGFRQFLFYTASGNLRYFVGSAADGAEVVYTINTRAFACGWHDGTSQRLQVNNGSVDTHTRITNHGSYDGTYVGTRNDLVFDLDGEVGPMMFWKGGFPDAAARTSLYNSGKGKLCADLITAEKVDLVSCWDMTENGGPYVDSIGSNDLTGINTPTRVAGLVERSDSGMSVRLNDTDGSHLISTDTSLARGDQDFTVSLWVNPYGVTGTLNLAIGQDATPDFDFIIQHVDSFLRCRKENDAGVLEAAAVANAYTLGVWRMATLRYTASSNLLECGVDDDAFTGTTLASDGMAMVGAHQFTVGYTSSEPNAAIDNLGFWPVALTDAQRTTLYNSGAGTFYAAFLDFIFNGPRFAWSQPPQVKRIES